MRTTVKNENKAKDYLEYALYAFGGLGLEVLLVLIESNIWNVSINQWSLTQNIIHWTVTSLVWGGVGFFLVKQLPKVEKKHKKINLIMSIVILVISISYTTFSWNGFKPLVELSNNGYLKFIFQYIYYAFESLLLVLIIAYGQKALETWFNHVKIIPFGGLVLALTWGAIHVLTQGVSTGLYTCIQSLLYGCIYLTLAKDFKLSYIAIVLMFML